MTRTYRVLALVTVFISIVTAGTASAQGYSPDARKIALGGNAGDSANIAMEIVDKAFPYTVIVIPLGLIQVFQGGLDKFNPTKASFDPVRAAELAASPLHYTFGRAAENSGSRKFITDLRNQNLNTNLATYAGFKIPTSLSVQGLASPTVGGTVKFAKSNSGSFQGIYIGFGPYASFVDDLAVDQKLSDLLGLGTKCVSCNLKLQDSAQLQLALSTTIGYRGRIATYKAPSAEKSRDGVYYAFNYHILKGQKYVGTPPVAAGAALLPTIDVRFDTLADGTLTLAPTTTPFNVNDLQATKGTGHASDIGIEVVHGHFDVGFGLNGMGNQIAWTDFTLKTITLDSIATSVQKQNPDPKFTTTTTHPTLAPLVVRLPVVKTGNLAVHGRGVAAMMSFTDGYNGKSFHGGVEKLIGPLWIRGGGKYSRRFSCLSRAAGAPCASTWDPTCGLGIGNKVALDLAFFGTHANLEGKRLMAMAVSLRFAYKDKKSAALKK